MVGELRLRGETLAVDGLGMRDRTWSERREDRRERGSGYTYGHVSADEQFLVMTNVEGNQGRSARASSPATSSVMASTRR